MGFLHFIQNHFLHVLPLLVAAAVGVAIIIERYKALVVLYPLKNSEGFFVKIRELILNGQTSEAVQLCDQYPTKPIARVAKEGLLRAHLPESLIEHGMDLSVEKEIQNITKRTSFLATIANVATLLGLFGTIAGLIGAFEAVSHADPQQKSALLSAGISTAMNATMAGLGVAIPCMVAYSFLMNRSNALTSELEQSSIRIIDILKQRFYSPQNTSSSMEERLSA